MFDLKKIICLLLAVLFVFYGCTLRGTKENGETTAIADTTAIEETTKAEETETTPAAPSVSPEELLNTYLKNIDSYTVSTREFGTPKSYIDMSEKFVAGILYPETQYSFIDSEIEKWIEETANEYQTTAESREGLSDAAELTVSYESFNIDDTLVSVVLSGSFFAPYMAHPDDIVTTFVADIKKETLISARDIIASDRYDELVNKVASSAGVNIADIDEEFLDNAFFTEDAFEVVLKRGKYLPMSDGHKSVTFTYGEIGEMISDSYKGLFVKEEETTKAEDTTLPPETTVPDTTVIPDTTLPPETTPTVPDTDGQSQDTAVTVDPSKPMIALTFDDGPSAHTDRLLDIFKQYGGKGTFFVVGELIDSRTDTVKRIRDEGHEIGNHSWNHRQLTTLTYEELVDQIMITKAKIMEVLGIDCKIMRPPYGAFNDFVKATGKELGIAFVNWSVDTLDWKTKNADAIYNEIIGSAQNGAIILCHDLHKTTVDAMETVIPKLIDMGYQLVTVSTLMSYSDTQLTAGEIHYRQ